MKVPPAWTAQTPCNRCSSNLAQNDMQPLRMLQLNPSANSFNIASVFSTMQDVWLALSTPNQHAATSLLFTAVQKPARYRSQIYNHFLFLMCVVWTTNYLNCITCWITRMNLIYYVLRTTETWLRSVTANSAILDDYCGCIPDTSTFEVFSFGIVLHWQYVAQPKDVPVCLLPSAKS